VHALRRQVQVLHAKKKSNKKTYELSSDEGYKVGSMVLKDLHT
jgi:hypothetical protein